MNSHNITHSVSYTIPSNPGRRTALLQKLRDPATTAASHLFFDEYESQLERIYQDRTALTQALQKLDQADEEVQELISIQKAFNSPAQSLAPELVREVLNFSISLNTISYDFPCELLALRLSQVCSRWRTSARTFAPLWSMIFIAIGAHTNITASSGLRESLLKQYLELSGTAPLTIQISHLTLSSPSLSEVDGPHTLDPFNRDLIRHIVQHRDRWIEFVVCPSLLCLIPTELKIALPTLERLKVLPIPDMEEAWGDWILKLPVLHHLDIEGLSQLQNIHLSRLTITHLHLFTLEISELSILQRLLHLCILEVQWLCNDDGDATSTCIFPKLFTLRVQGVDNSEVVRQLFSTTSFPTLSTLELCNAFTGPSHSWPQDEFISFLIHSASFLRTLTLANFWLSQVQLLALLPHLSELKCLSIGISTHSLATSQSDRVGCNFMSALRTLDKVSDVSARRFTYLPSLRELDLGGVAPTKGTFDAVISMAHARAGYSELKAVRVRAQIVLADWLAIPQLEDLAKRNVKVFVSCDEFGGRSRSIWNPYI
ncbi:hypothetical protein DL96DRAFT_1617613 [Flagelloscypha sp. PMI_526]|nr:hypothetical protein DL96DRAFT_1617613 [Flagelloscypha sp. PMI_526]